MQELAVRIQILEDVEALKKLKASYCYLADAGIAGDPARFDELISHFAEDAWVEFAGFGVHQGRPALEKFFKETVQGLWTFASHMVMNPVIDVDGHAATAQWLVHVACTSRKSNVAVWVHGKYDEAFEKVNGAWRWKSITFVPYFITPATMGWAHTRIMTADEF